MGFSIKFSLQYIGSPQADLLLYWVLGMKSPHSVDSVANSIDLSEKQNEVGEIGT